VPATFASASCAVRSSVVSISGSSGCGVPVVISSADTPLSDDQPSTSASASGSAATTSGLGLGACTERRASVRLSRARGEHDAERRQRRRVGQRAEARPPGTWRRGKRPPPRPPGCGGRAVRGPRTGMRTRRRSRRANCTRPAAPSRSAGRRRRPASPCGARPTAGAGRPDHARSIRPGPGPPRRSWRRGRSPPSRPNRSARRPASTSTPAGPGPAPPSRTRSAAPCR